MKAVILCGGEGTRMRPLTFAVPKPLLPVGDYTILEVCIAWLRNNGIKNVALSLGWRGDFIKAYLANKNLGVDLHMVQEDQKLGTAGPLNTLLRDWIGNDDVFVMNGDILTRLDLRAFQTSHIAQDADITVASRWHKTKSRFGVVRDIGGSIFIEEKPEHGQLVSTGMYILSPKAVDQIPVGREFHMPELVNMCCRNNLRPRTYVFDEGWVAMEYPDELEAVNKDSKWTSWVLSNACVDEAWTKVP